MNDDTLREWLIQIDRRLQRVEKHTSRLFYLYVIVVIEIVRWFFGG